MNQIDNKTNIKIYKYLNENLYEKKNMFFIFKDNHLIKCY